MQQRGFRVSQAGLRQWWTAAAIPSRRPANRGTGRSLTLSAAPVPRACISTRTDTWHEPATRCYRPGKKREPHSLTDSLTHSLALCPHRPHRWHKNGKRRFRQQILRASYCFRRHLSRNLSGFSVGLSPRGRRGHRL